MRLAEARPAALSPDLVADIITQFRTAMGELRCVSSRRMLRRGVSISNLYLASVLAQHGEMPMSRIADLLDVSLSATTGIIDRMEERGLVERVRDPIDRRVVLVRVSAAGREMLDEVEVLKQDLLESILKRLGPDRLEALTAVVTDLRTAVREAAEADPDLFADHPTHDRGGRHRAAHDASAEGHS